MPAAGNLGLAGPVSTFSCRFDINLRAEWVFRKILDLAQTFTFHFRGPRGVLRSAAEYVSCDTRVEVGRSYDLSPAVYSRPPKELLKDDGAGS